MSFLVEEFSNVFYSKSSKFLRSLTKILSMKFGTVDFVAALKKLKFGSICIVRELELRCVSETVPTFSILIDFIFSRTAKDSLVFS